MLKVSGGKDASVENTGFHLTGVVTGILVLVVGLVVLWGWMVGVPRLVEWFPGFVPVRLLSAMAMCLVGAGLLLGSLRRSLGEGLVGALILLLGLGMSLGSGGILFEWNWKASGLLEMERYAGFFNPAESWTLVLLGLAMASAILPGNREWIFYFRLGLSLAAAVVIGFEFFQQVGDVTILLLFPEAAPLSLQAGIALLTASLGHFGHVLESSPKRNHLDRLGLVGKFIVLMVASILFVSILLWAVALYALNRALLETERKGLHLDQTFLLQAMDDSFQELREDLRVLARSPSLRRFLKDPDYHEEARNVLCHIVEEKGAYLQAGVLSTDQGGMPEIEVLPEECHPRETLDGVRFAHEWWFEELREAGPGELVYSPVTYSESVRTDRQGNKRILLTAACWIGGEESRAKALFLTKDLTRILESAEGQLVSGGKPILSDRDGWILHGEPHLFALSGKAAEVSLFGLFPEFAPESEAVLEEALFRMDEEDRVQALILRPFVIDSEDSQSPPGMHLGIIHRFETAARLSSQARMQSLVIGLPFVFAFALISFFLIRSVVHPLKQLIQATESFGRWEELGELPPRGDDEIGILSRSFRIMAERVRRRSADLGREIDQRKSLEEERTRLIENLEGKNRELAQMVYIASHDLRSPLVNIQGFSQEISIRVADLVRLVAESSDLADLRTKVRPLLGEEIPESLEYIGSSARKMDGLLKGLLRVSRVGTATLRMTGLNMKRLLAEVSQNFEYVFRDAGGAIELGDTPAIFGDPAQINQVFSNLIENALKFRHPERPPLIRVEGKISSEGGWVVYRVRDNGLGIAKEHKEKIFNLFHRLRPGEIEGDGLGLTIVRRIMERHGGRVEVDSKAGEWTEFSLFFPATFRPWLDQSRQ